VCGSRPQADGPDVTVKVTPELTMMRCDRRGVRGAEVWAALPTDADASSVPIFWFMLPGCGGRCGDPGAVCECPRSTTARKKEQTCERLKDSSGRAMVATGRCVCSSSGGLCVAECKGGDGAVRSSSAREDEVLAG
jgi:hypothetical protein